MLDSTRMGDLVVPVAWARPGVAAGGRFEGDPPLPDLRLAYEHGLDWPRLEALHGAAWAHETEARMPAREREAVGRAMAAHLMAAFPRDEMLVLARHGYASEVTRVSVNVWTTTIGAGSARVVVTLPSAVLAPSSAGHASVPFHPEDERKGVPRIRAGDPDVEARLVAVERREEGMRPPHRVTTHVREVVSLGIERATDLSALVRFAASEGDRTGGGARWREVVSSAPVLRAYVAARSATGS